MKTKECFVFTMAATLAVTLAYKLGKRDGFEAFLKKAFEDNPALKEIDFKVKDYTITWKK